MMDLDQATARRKLVGKACMVFCLLAYLAVLDGLIAKFREPTNLFHVLPGEAVDVNGPIPETIKDPEALTYASESPDLAVAFELIHSGYFLGGNMWRGRLVTSGNLSPGKYTVTVRPKDYPEDKPGYQLQVVVYPDALSQQTASKSIIRSRTGTSPYLVAAVLLPLIGITLGSVYLLSQRIGVLHAARGLAEIYQVKRGEGKEYQIAFGLGSKHGLRDGDQVTLLDPEGHYVGTAQVEEALEEDSVALVSLDQDIRPGYFASRQ